MARLLNRLYTPVTRLVLPLSQRQHFPVRLLHYTSQKMSAKDIVTAYNIAVPDKQEQNLPGLDKNIVRM